MAWFLPFSKGEHPVVLKKEALFFIVTSAVGEPCSVLGACAEPVCIVAAEKRRCAVPWDVQALGWIAVCMQSLRDSGGLVVSVFLRRQCFIGNTRWP